MDSALVELTKKKSNFAPALKKREKDFFLSSYIDVNNIVFLTKKNRNDVISELIENLYKTQKIKNKNIFFDNIIKREKLFSTGIGMGVAIPHTKNGDFENFFIAICIQKKNKINWLSIDKIAVNIVFMIAGPENKQSEYLKILSKLTSLIKNESFKNKLLKFEFKEDIFAFFDQN